MKIVKIIREQSTEKEDYTLITFKNWRGKVFTETYITLKERSRTFYAKTGGSIGYWFFDTVEAFLRTGDKEHEY